MKKLPFLLILICLSLPVLAKSKTKNVNLMPEWIETPYSVFNRSEYFAQTGSDKNKNLAELRAVENIAAIFARDVKSETEAESHFNRVVFSDESEETVLHSTLNSRIISEVDQEDLIGIEIADTFYDSKNDTWYAVAILDKEKTSNLYKELIKKNNDSIIKLLEAEKQLAPGLVKNGYIYKALILSQINEKYFPRFYLINSKNCDDVKKNSFSSDELKIKFINASSQITTSIEILNDTNPIIKSACESVLAEYGFKISTGNSDYRLIVEVTPNYRDVKNPEMVYCEYSVFARVLDSNNTEFLPWSYSGRAGGKTMELAKQKACMQIKEKILTDYANKFEEYFME